MIWLKMGLLKESVELFTHGAENTPWYYERQYFQTALSLALMKQRKFEEASRVLTSACDATPELLPAVTLLHMHVWAELDHKSAALEHYHYLRQTWPTVYAELREKVFGRYVTRDAARSEVSDHMMWNQECDVVLLA